MHCGRCTDLSMSERLSDNGGPGADAPPLKWPLAAGIIGAFLAVILGGGMLLTRAAHPEVAGLAAQGTATTAPLATATLAVAPTAVRARTEVISAQLTAVRAATSAAATPTSFPAARTITTAAAGKAVAGGARDDVTSVAFATSQPTRAPIGWWDAVSDVPEDERIEVHQAYARFWQIRVQALLELAPERLTEIMAGKELTVEQRAINDLRANGRAQRVDIEHHERITWATSDAATVLDEYVSHTVLVDAETKAPLEDPPSAPFRIAYLFRKVDGRWLAVEAFQVVYAQ
jgi:hypothetical protein